MTTDTGSVGAPLGPGVYDALDRARVSLRAATEAETPGERYVAAHVAALRTAAAVIAARSRPGPRRGSRSAWVLISKVAPEFGDWAAFFAAGADKRAAAEAGLPNAVSPREADDLVRDVGRFVEVVERSLHIPRQAA